MATLNRPKQLNALTPSMLRTVHDLYRLSEKTPTTAVLLQGTYRSPSPSTLSSRSSRRFRSRVLFGL